MRVYRICKEVHAKTGHQAMSGEGGLYASARWHTKGRKIIYTATSTPLAILEIAVNLRQPKIIPLYVIVEVDVPDRSILTLPSDSLPKGWDTTDSEPFISRQIGDRWLMDEVSLGLSVPSVVVPNQHNVLINPLHPEFDRVRFSEPIPFPFDTRIKR